VDGKAAFDDVLPLLKRYCTTLTPLMLHIQVIKSFKGRIFIGLAIPVLIDTFNGICMYIF
jgi:hypothetical protein